jgi:N-carbamoyl-L-amino-acid hydrolase
MTAYDTLFAELEPVGRDKRTGGYTRYAYDAAERTCREWFVGAAQQRGLDVEIDRNGNLWAWWGAPGPDALVLGSHLDSVAQGGAYDGPLGVISALAAVEQLKGKLPSRPVAIVAFADEEGGRFGVPCAGSRLMTGALDPERARALKDNDGITMAEAMAAARHRPELLGKDEARLRSIGAYVELHVEQGRTQDTPVAVGTGIWPHGRYRFTFTGESNHAGTTEMAGRKDPITAFAQTALAAEDKARQRGLRATFGRIAVHPNVTNAIPQTVTAWLDSRGAVTADVEALVAELADGAQHTGVHLEVFPESVSRAVTFDNDLTDAVAAAIGDPPRIPTAAGHDAGILAEAGVPTAMLFVRNPTGVSHSPAEHAEASDCHAGVEALTAVVERLACETPA